ncbi:MAG: FAD-dependent thymidylate synthase [Oscillospiraceae bacterium]|nr:FAD-dependent thymidylate synthase [Oscillospiraceae bacterium]
MNLKLLAYTPEPEKVVAAAAKLCYSKSGIDDILENLTPEKTEKFIRSLLDMGHESPFEHISFTFGAEGVSRALLAQITRHRIASYSVKSQRYVSEAGFEYITPYEIAGIPEAEEIFEEAVEKAGEYYRRLSEILQKRHYDELIAAGVDEKKAARDAEKRAIEDARFVLPNACETKMVFTMNARSLFNFFSHRCCNRAQWEIRFLADEMLRLVKEVAPSVFKTAGPPCIRESCPEGRMSCGKAAEMRKKYLDK